MVKKTAVIVIAAAVQLLPSHANAQIQGDFRRAPDDQGHGGGGGHDAPIRHRSHGSRD